MKVIQKDSPSLVLPSQPQAAGPVWLLEDTCGLWQTNTPRCAQAEGWSVQTQQHNTTEKPADLPIFKMFCSSAFILDFTINSTTALN